MPQMTRALFVDPDIYTFGGAQTHCIRGMMILQNMGFDITLVHTGGPLDSNRICSWCGMRLDPAKVSFISVPGARHFFKIFGRLGLLQYAVALAYARRMAADYDIVLTLCAECPVEHPRVVQYIAYPIFLVDRLSLQHLGNSYSSLFRYGLRLCYHGLGRLVSGWSRKAVCSHRTLANSRWTANQVRRLYGETISVEVVYPGVCFKTLADGAPRRPFAERENNFVLIGRLVPNKRPDWAIEIVRRLREEKGHDVGLHIVGRADGKYAKIIQQRVADKPWVHLHGGMLRDEMERLVESQKWGLHCYPFEHYGSAPVEMQSLGCITFVPDDGGQCEVVRNDAQHYHTIDEAVEKIDKVMNQPELQRVLLAEAEESSKVHTEVLFAERFAEIVDEVLHSSGRS